MKKLPILHIRVCPDDLDWLHATAKEQQCSVGHVVRAAISILQDEMNGKSCVDRRAAVIREFLFAAMDALVKEQIPHQRAEVWEKANDRVNSLL